MPTLNPLQNDQYGRPIPINWVLDASGKWLVNPDSWAKTYGYAGANLTTTTLVDPDNGNTYIQTLTYNGAGQITADSGWVKQ